MKILLKSILIVLVLSGMASCSLTKVKEGSSVSGTSIDALRSGEVISIHGLGEEKLKVSVLAKGGHKCVGTFEHKGSSRGYLGMSAAKNTYHGSFSGNATACKDAVGEKATGTIAFVHIRSGGILSSKFMATEMVYVCNDVENDIGFCSPHNTFKLDN